MPARPGGNHLGTPYRRVRKLVVLSSSRKRQGRGGLPLLFCRDQGPTVHSVEPHG